MLRFLPALVLFVWTAAAAAEERSVLQNPLCPDARASSAESLRQSAVKADVYTLFADLEWTARANSVLRADVPRYWERPPPPPSAPESLGPNCAWVELEGYFRTVSYHDYRGQLFGDAGSFYLENGSVGRHLPHFWVEDWGDDDQPSRYELQGRRVRFTGQVYDLCLALEQSMRDAGKWGFIMSGPCHYSYSGGKILTNVRLEAVLTEEPAIATDPEMRTVFDGQSVTEARSMMPDLPLDGLSDKLSLVLEPDAWIRLALEAEIRAIQAGPDAYLERVPYYARSGFDRDMRERLVGRQSAFAALRATDGFLSLDPARAPFAVFHKEEALRRAERREEPLRVFTACFAFSSENPRWPVFGRDAVVAAGPWVCADNIWLRQDATPSLQIR